MPASEIGVIERIARVLAAQRLSSNAEGYEQSVSREVDSEWIHYRSDAVAVLRTLREPDSVMAGAGDAEVWRRMVEAALGDFNAGELGR